MLPEIQDNRPGKIAGMDSETAVTNTLSRYLAYAAERETSRECIYLLYGTDQRAVSLRAEWFVLQTVVASSVLWFLVFCFFFLFPPSYRLLGRCKADGWEQR